MAFVSASGLTEEATERSVEIDGMRVVYHDVGEGPPALFLHSHGPGTTAWITWHKVVDEFAKHFRCILYDMPNFTKTGPMVYKDGSHAVQARVGTRLLDALGIERCPWVGNSQGGQSALSAAIRHPERVSRFVLGGSHIATGGDVYFLATRPDEAGYFTELARRDPTRENMRLYLSRHIYDQRLVTDELVDYVRERYVSRPYLIEARNASKSVPHDYRPQVPSVRAPAMMVHGRHDKMVPLEVSITLLSLLPDARLVVFNDTAHWTPFENPREYARHVLPFLLDG